MPQYYLVPKRIARALPALERITQRIEALCFRVLFFLIRKPGFRRASRIAMTLFGLVGPLTEKSAKVKGNLAIAFPDKSPGQIDQLSRDVFRSLGLAVVELVRMPQIRAEWEQRIELVVDPAAERYLEEGLPGVFVTAHVGPWQVAPIPLIRRYFGDRPMAMVYAPESNPLIHDMLRPLRTATGVELVSSEAGLRPLLRALSRGQSLALAVDTRLPTGKLVPFFGVEALTNTSPARMALRLGCPLVPVHTERLDHGKYRVTVQAPIEAANSSADADEQAIDMSRQLNAVFEDWIRHAPGEWLCLKRRWPKAGKL